MGSQPVSRTQRVSVSTALPYRGARAGEEMYSNSMEGSNGVRVPKDGSGGEPSSYGIDNHVLRAQHGQHNGSAGSARRYELEKVDAPGFGGVTSTNAPKRGSNATAETRTKHHYGSLSSRQSRIRDTPSQRDHHPPYDRAVSPPK